MEPPARHRLVIGVGNPHRGDDGAGRAVALRLRELRRSGAVPADVQIEEIDGEPTALLSRLEGVATVFVVDACLSGAAPGTIHRFDLSAGPLPSPPSGSSTHGIGVATAIELARAIGRLPAQCIVYAIEGRSFEVGAPLSPRVSLVVPRFARRLAVELAAECADEARD